MKSKIIRKADAKVHTTPWGRLEWMVGSGEADYGMTFGRVTFKPGENNPAHLHPNCDEILFVVSGTIEHSIPEGGTTVLNAGDAILLPRNKFHRARNVGKDDAVCVVVFNSAHREIVHEEDQKRA
jgi:quercetin dioxygenase-like cupin family protein